jgi:hypothetical protein
MALAPTLHGLLLPAETRSSNLLRALQRSLKQYNNCRSWISSSCTALRQASAGHELAWRRRLVQDAAATSQVENNSQEQYVSAYLSLSCFTGGKACSQSSWRLFRCPVAKGLGLSTAA